MIVVSVLLVLAAGVLLGFGLVRLDEPLLYSSIGVSALAALALVVGVRRLAAVRAGRGVITVRPGGATLGLGSGTVRPEQTVRPGSVTGRATPRPVGRATPRPVGRATVGARLDPPSSDFDESGAAEETLSAADAARVAVLDSDVMVIDGLPRYHVTGCPIVVALGGVEPDAAPGTDEPPPVAEALPVAEAVELGFTPCGVCRPVAALLRTTESD